MRFPNCPGQQERGHDQHERRGPVLDFPEQVHAPADDVNIQTPEEQEREPFCWCVPANWSAKQCWPARDDGAEEGVQRFAANPRLNPKPAAGDNSAHQGRKIRAVGAVTCARENREGNSVFRAGVRVQQNRDQDDRVAQKDRDQSLPPIHARTDQTRREHVSRNAMRHAYPKRSVVIGGPVSIRYLDRREVTIEERAGADFFERLMLKFDASVGVLDCFVIWMHAQSYAPLTKWISCLNRTSACRL